MISRSGNHHHEEDSGLDGGAREKKRKKSRKKKRMGWKEPRFYTNPQLQINNSHATKWPMKTYRQQ